MVLFDLSRHRRAGTRHAISAGWTLASTAFVWAGPAQIILITTLGPGATIVQAALAVTVSAIRLFPMVVSVLPMMRTTQTKRRHLILATHLIAMTLWVECYRFCRRCRASGALPSSIGLGVGLMAVCLTATTIGYALAANLPPLLGRGILLLTPLAFLFSTARNCRELADIVALALGLLAVSVGVDAGQRRRYSGQRRDGGHHRLWCPQVAGARMSNFIGDCAAALVVLFIAGVIPNQIWRMLGLWLGSGIDEGSELLVWVRAVATAILAGVIAQIVVRPLARWRACRTSCATARCRSGFMVFISTRHRSLRAWCAAKWSCSPANGGSAD